MASGLHFRKVDLHTHTPASNCFIDKGTSPEAFVEAAIAAGIDALAITDHNSGAWIDSVKGAAGASSLTIFPGVEITASEGLHIVALLDTDKGSAEVANLLGALGIKAAEQGKPDALCKRSSFEVIEEVRQHGGLAILAHVDLPRGAFKQLDGNPLRRLFNEAPYHAIETSTGDPIAAFGKDNGFHRVPACYQSSDNPDPGEQVKHSHRGIGSKFCYFKLDAEIRLEGLRQCLADPEVRIRKMGDLLEAAVPHVVSLKASEGFLKYPLVRFHPGLNSIIGGKGVGKSLIVEFLRWALDQSSSDPDVVKDCNGKLEKRLGPFNSVEVVCQMPSGTQYKITRTLKGMHQCVNAGTGEVYTGSIGELFPVLAYSQTEVIKIAENEQAQLALIDGFIDRRQFTDRISDLEPWLTENDRDLAVGIRAGSDLEVAQRQVDTISGQIAEVDMALSVSPEEARLLRDFKECQVKKHTMKIHSDYVSRITRLVTDTSNQLESALPPGLTATQEVDPDLAWTHARCLAARQCVTWALSLARLAADEMGASIAVRADTWAPVYEAKEAEYLAALRSATEKQRLEAERRRLVEQLENSQGRVAVCQGLAAKLPSLQTTRDMLLEQLDEAYDGHFQLRKRAYDDLSWKSGGRLRLDLARSANRRDFAAEIKKMVQGSGARTLDIEAVTGRMMPREFVELVSNRDIAELANRGEITPRSAQTLIERLWSAESMEPVLALSHICYPEDVPSILFRRDDGQYAPLTELSVGQKCTALLYSVIVYPENWTGR